MTLVDARHVWRHLRPGGWPSRMPEALRQVRRPLCGRVRHGLHCEGGFPLPISSKILCLYPRNSASGIRRSLDKEHWPPLKSCRMVADRPGNHHTDQQGMNSRNTHIHTHTNTCREFSWTLYPIQPFPLVTFLRCCRVSVTDTRIGG